MISLSVHSTPVYYQTDTTLINWQGFTLGICHVMVIDKKVHILPHFAMICYLNHF